MASITPTYPKQFEHLNDTITQRKIKFCISKFYLLRQPKTQGVNVLSLINPFEKLRLMNYFTSLKAGMTQIWKLYKNDRLCQTDSLSIKTMDPVESKSLLLFLLATLLHCHCLAIVVWEFSKISLKTGYIRSAVKYSSANECVIQPNNMYGKYRNTTQ